MTYRGVLGLFVASVRENAEHTAETEGLIDGLTSRARLKHRATRPHTDTAGTKQRTVRGRQQVNQTVSVTWLEI